MKSGIVKAPARGLSGALFVVRFSWSWIAFGFKRIVLGRS
jgi:hypothetical protein